MEPAGSAIGAADAALTRPRRSTGRVAARATRARLAPSPASPATGDRPSPDAWHLELGGMEVKIKAWHAVASWTWTTEDDVCGICHMQLDGCAPGAPGPGDDSPVVWGRVSRLCKR
eukprot:scaffold2426_cov84-Isochrysis_galbana.AAC.3